MEVKLQGVEETLLITLWARAYETKKRLPGCLRILWPLR